MKLSTRLALAMVAVVLLTATAIGLLIYRNIVAAELPRALDRLATDTDVIAIRLEAAVGGARFDATTQGRAVDGLVNAIVSGGVSPRDGIPEAQWRDRLASRFVAELTAKPAYAQYRLIGIADGGREIVRVDRTGPDGAIRVVPDSELQRKGDQDYFKATLALPPDTVHVSRINLNREGGFIATPPIPTLRAAAPVLAPDGNPFGILIINVDMRHAFAAVRAVQQPKRSVYIVNERGDYLLHPDSSREFGFERDQPIRLQDDYPGFAEVLAQHRTRPAVIKSKEGESFGFGWRSLHLAGGPRVTVIERVPYDQLLTAAASLRNSILEGALAAVIGAILLAVLLARSLTQPLVKMTRAVERFSQDGSLPLPAHARGEIGVLANAFARMAVEMQAKTAALNQEIEERRRLFDTSPDLILVTDRQGQFIRVSPSSQAILGYSPDEMIGHSAVRFLHPDDLEPTREEMRMARRGRQMRNFATRYLHRNGTIVPMAWSGVWSEPEQCHFFIGRDMTEQKRLEEAERQTSETLSAVIDASPIAIICVRAADRIVLVWSRAAEQIFGYTADEIVGQRYPLIPVDQSEESVKIFERALAGETLRNIQVARRRKDGTLVDISYDAATMHDANGVRAIAFAMADITESKKAREALLESEQMARDIIANSLDAFVQLNQAGEITEWNPQAEAMFGWTHEEALANPATNLFLAGEYQPRYPILIERLEQSPDGTVPGQRFEFDAVRKDGRKIRAEVALTALRRRSGYVVNGFMRDLTAQIAAEEQLRHAQKMEAVGQLTGGIAHDFNNMLTVITGTIEILQDGVADRPHLAAITKLIGEAADRGAELTRRLLAFARKQPLQPREIDVNALMVETARLMRPTLGEHIEIESKSADGVWPALIDPGQLSSALLNLALNARDAMPEGGKLTLETRNVVLDETYAKLNPEVRPGNYVMIAVSDTGTGIPEMMIDKIFEPFFSTKPVGQGTGLGLSMVYGFVKQSGGHIKIYSEVGLGTTFRIYLPQAGETPSAQLADTIPEAQYEGSNETIFVVEDDPLVRDYVIAQLHSLGYQTIAAEGPADALALVDEGAAFDLLFTDVVMPGAMNGRQLTEEIAKRRAPLKVLYTSGYTEDAIVHHGRLDPGVLLLAKPYRKAELARMLRTALSPVGIVTVEGHAARRAQHRLAAGPR